MSQRVVFYNGEFVPEAEARISIYDSALMFGDMVFEMTRSFNKEQFKLREHLERLYAGLRILHIPAPMPLEEMAAAVLETVRRNEPAFAPDDEHRVLIDVTRGLLSIYHQAVPGHKGPNVIIADFPLRWTVTGNGALFDRGVHMVLTNQRAIPASLLEPKIKNRSRLHYMMANIEASQYSGHPWALLLDPDGFIAEGTGSNFFLVKKGVVMTPEPRNILRGVSRAYVMEELCPLLGLPVVERNLEPYDVYTADEAFVTCTPFCLLPVTALNGTAVGSGVPGPVTQRLLARWGENVGVDIPGQIKGWNAQEQAQGIKGPTPYVFHETEKK